MSRVARGQSRQGAFISYARQDGEQAARALHARLTAEAPDIPAWLDRLELEGGIGWWKQIEQQLDRAEFLILVMTPAALNSENTRREWRSARQLGVCVYPVKGASDTELDYESLPKWMSKSHFYDPVLEWEKLVAHLRRGCRTTRVPFMAPPVPTGFVPRPRETNELIELLLTGDNGNPVAITTALRGAGGFGKTTLAAAICHDDRVLDGFDDGILWVTLGQTPNLLNELIKVHAALTGERPGFVDVEDAVRELTLRLENKACLIVIDDAWNAAHVAPFLRAGARCARLITTRLFEVAAEARRVDVDQMEPGEATQLLLARIGSAPIDLESFRRLALRLGGWPLPIKLVGSAMRQRIARGDSVANALEYVSRALEKRGITAFDKNEASDRAEAVGRTVAASLDLLTPEDQRRCADLSIFPEDAAFPLSAVAALWTLDEFDSEDLARRLDDLALLEFDLKIGVLRMHDVLRAFLSARVPDTQALHARLVDAWSDPLALPDGYAWRRYTYHAQRAGRTDRAKALLLDPRWYVLKLRATDIHALIADFEPVAGDRTLDLVRDALRLSAPGVAANPAQLNTQLVGRLLEHDEPEIARLRADIIQSADGPWLKPIHPALDAPGGMLLMTLVGHEGEVTSLCTDQQQRLLSASQDGTVRVWDRDQGQQLHILRHRNLGARGVSAVSGRSLAISGGADGLLYLWDLERAERLHGFKGERGPAYTAVALSDDGRVAITGSRDKSVRVWDIEARTGKGALEGHRERVTSVALTGDGSRAVSGSEDCTVRVWNVRTGTLERTIEGHASSVNAVAVSSDGRRALSGASDHTVKMWDLDTGACLRTLVGHTSSVTSVALASDGGRAISGSSDQTARLWDLNTGQAIATLQGHSDGVTAVSIDDTGRRAATGSIDCTIKLWRLDALRPATSSSAHAGSVVSIVFSPDGRLCASGGSDGRIMIRNVESGRVLRSIDAHSQPLRSLAFTDDGTCVLSSGVDHTYRMWTVDDGVGSWIPVRHLAPIDYCALSGRARYLTTACADRTVSIWEVPSGVVVQRYGTRQLFDHLIEPAPRRRELPDTEENRDRYLPGEDVYQVALIRMSADGRYAVLSATTTSKSRRGLTAACLLVLTIGNGGVQSLTMAQSEPIVAFSVDSHAKRLLYAKADHTIELWDLEQRVRLVTMRGHTEKVNAVGFSGDERSVISCARDRTARVWNTDTGEQITAYTADHALRSLAAAPNDQVVALGDVSGRVHMLRLE